MMSMCLRKNKSLNGIAFHWTRKGDPIILINDLGQRDESWREQIKFLKKKFTFVIDI